MMRIKRRNKQGILILILISIVAIYIFGNFLKHLNDRGKTYKNYFLHSSEIRSTGLLVNTSSCKIPDLNPFHEIVLHGFFKSVSKPNCAVKYGKITYTEKTYFGESTNSFFCCYKSISRVDQTIDDFNSEADSQFKFSDECTRITNKITAIQDEFIKVFCYQKYFGLFSDLIYTNQHAFAQPHKNQNILNKINFWKTRFKSFDANENKTKEGKNNKIPPNILILGLDSVSRLNFIRNLNKTRKYLQKIGSIEMNGFTKVGENTFPNAVPAFSGFSEMDFKEICLPSFDAPQDSCPYIWKSFSDSKYLTAYIEDSPRLCGFNYLKTGFVRQPTDFYLRPFMLPIYQDKNYIIPGKFQHFFKKCAGPERPHEKLYGFFSSLVKMAKEKTTPIFLYSWITDLTHDDMNALQTADDFLEDFLQHLDLDNSILFVLGDHGFRFGGFRETGIGWFEDKLPWLSIYLPSQIKRKFPQWTKSLQINSKRLVSPFDLFHTWSQLLREFSPFPPNETNKKAPSQNTKNTVQRKFGQSLFEPVAESRKCSDAGIQTSFCACFIPRQISTENLQVQKAAAFSIHFINSALPPQCSKLKLEKITAGARGEMKQRNSLETDQNETEDEEMVFIVGFTVRPGDFRFEATVNWNKTDGFSIQGDVLRTSAFNTDVSCVKDPRLQRLCYCS